MDQGAPHYLATFHFYGYLNGFLLEARRGQTIDYRFSGCPGIKDPIEALGVPHTEAEAIAVNGTSVDFSYQLLESDRVSVYPACNLPSYLSLKPLREPFHNPAFVLDVHLGKLARLLRLLGMDVLYCNRYNDRELVDISVRDGRALLTRDRRLLFHRRIVYGHYVREIEPLAQAREVINHYQLTPLVKPFTRCINCNGLVSAVDKTAVEYLLASKTVRYYDAFYQCGTCGQVYWKGTHFKGLKEKLRALGIEQ